MKKISNLLMMALLAIGMGLTSCDEQLDNAVTPYTPGVTPGTDEGEVTSITVDLSKIDEKYLDTEKTKLQLTVGDEVTLSFTILPEEMASTEVELTAADATILSIDGLKVKALKEGETKVTAKAGEKTAECTVTVTLAYPIALSAVTSDYIGSVIASDGNVYSAKTAVPAGKTAVAMIAYVGSDTYDATYKNGLAIALADEAQSNWSTAKSTCEGKTAITGAKWCLPSRDQWIKMINTAGLNNLGLQEDENAFYWSSTEVDDYNANLFRSTDGLWNDNSKGNTNQVRACLVF